MFAILAKIAINFTHMALDWFSREIRMARRPSEEFSINTGDRDLDAIVDTL